MLHLFFSTDPSLPLLDDDEAAIEAASLVILSWRMQVASLDFGTWVECLQNSSTDSRQNSGRSRMHTHGTPARWCRPRLIARSLATARLESLCVAQGYAGSSTANTAEDRDYKVIALSLTCPTKCAVAPRARWTAESKRAAHRLGVRN